jgi:hypothetical protein
MEPALNLIKSAWMPSLKMIPFWGICDSMINSVPGLIIPLVRFIWDDLLKKGSRTTKTSWSLSLGIGLYGMAWILAKV